MVNSALVSGPSGPGLTLAGDIVLCSWTRHSTLTVPLSTNVYKWIPANLMLGVTLRWTHPIQGGVEILLVASSYRNRISSHEPLGTYADFIHLSTLQSITNFLHSFDYFHPLWFQT